MQRTDKEEEGIMGKVIRVLCALSVLVLAGAACAPCPIKKDTASTAKQAVVITVDPEMGSFTVQDNSGKLLNPATSGPTKAGTLTTSKTPITVTVELLPAGDAPPDTIGGCRIIIINGVQYCR